ncbi:MAG: hypothetical protein IJQ76_09150 [Prevotella sp.]|nr:hypothetical protein [Prevotella sp.]
MTKEEFLQLQSDHQQSGLSLKSYLKQAIERQQLQPWGKGCSCWYLVI